MLLYSIYLGRSQAREKRAEKKIRDLESQLSTEIGRKLEERNVLDWALGRLWKMNKNAREIARLERAAEVVADRVADMDGVAAWQLRKALEDLRKALEWLPARTRVVRRW